MCFGERRGSCGFPLFDVKRPGKRRSQFPNQFDCCSENREIEGLKNGNRNKGALKAQLHIAQGSALGHSAYPSIPAPCKGSYIKIKTQVSDLDFPRR